MRRLALAGVLAVALLAAVPAASSPSGTIRWLGCLQEGGGGRDGCKGARGVANTAFLALSADGRYLYATGRDSDSVAVFARDARLGGLRQLPGRAGCWTDSRSRAERGCATTPGLDRASGVAVSPDGKFLYVAGRDSDAVVAFRRARNGTLAPVGCVAGPRSSAAASCGAAPGLDEPIAIAISPDGRHVYVTSSAANGLVGFGRNAATGRLQPLGCLVDDTVKPLPPGCSPAKALLGASSVAVSPDGRSVYVTGPFASAVSAFARDPRSGALRQLGCISGNGAVRRDARCAPARAMEFAQYVVVSPDGRQVYVSATDRHSIIVFARNRTTGAITQLPGLDGCLSDFVNGPDFCRQAEGLALPLGIAFGRGGRLVFVGSFGYGSVGAFARNPKSGLLTQLGPCVSLGDPDCEKAAALDRAGFVAASPDTRHVYVNAPGSSAVVVVAVGREVRLARALRAVARRGRVSVAVACPKAAEGGCVGSLRATAETRGLRGKWSRPAVFDIAAGRAFSVPAPVRVPRGPGIRLAVLVTTIDQAGGDRTYLRSLRVARG